jgi:tetratricopeptide (TPR) repeat protein
MGKFGGFSAAVLVSLAFSGSTASSSSFELSEEAFAALDPTRPGRTACRANAGFDAAYAARLQLAADITSEHGMGAATIGLLQGIARSDLPLGGLKPEARRYFDQGLAFAYGFNHRAAIASFVRAREIDPSCSECWWGEALARGPNINAAMDAGQNASALHALEQARRLSAQSGAFTRALIAAQELRYSADPAADRSQLDRDYAQAMLALARQFPESDDLAVLAAEAAMNTSPWNYWSVDGAPAPFIAEAVGLIEGVMARTPDHPQASHLYIHLLELPDPAKAEAAADRLDKTGPAALGHLVHMPAHIYFRLGRYQDSIEANKRAVAADEAYLAKFGDDGLVRFGYYPHNVHFLLTSAQAMGDLPTVLSQTRKLESVIDTEIGRDLYWVQAIYAAPYFAHAQYSSPEAIIALTADPHPLEYVEAMRHYARAVAIGLNPKLGDFTAEIAAMERLAGSKATATMEANGFPAPLIIALATEVAKGRRAMASKRPGDAIVHFTKAAEMQKSVPYNEPPFWYYPVNQSLGAALYQAGRLEDAKTAFHAALFEAPNSALALFGLARTEARLGNYRERLASERAFAAVWRGDKSWVTMTRI